jgi:hypothetical protein
MAQKEVYSSMASWHFSNFLFAAATNLNSREVGRRRDIFVGFAVVCPVLLALLIFLHVSEGTPGDLGCALIMHLPLATLAAGWFQWQNKF